LDSGSGHERTTRVKEAIDEPSPEDSGRIPREETRLVVGCPGDSKLRVSRSWFFSSTSRIRSRRLFKHTPQRRLVSG